MGRYCAGLVGLLLATTAAHAGDVPLYQPAPAWVAKAVLDPAASTAADAPTRLIHDQQLRIEDGRLWVYTDVASRIASAEMLGQLATLTQPWMPDKGDLIIHELRIVRAGQEIDLLAAGKTFTVLRREQGLEQRQLTGLLSATMPVEGLQVGDILRMRYSTTISDAALSGHVQYPMPLMPAPMRVGFGRARILWDGKSGLRWKAQGDGIVAKPVQKGGLTELLIPLPVARQPEMPGDAPPRFRRPPLLELSTFSGWADVSKVFAALYATDGLIRPDGPLAAEVAAVRVGATPLDRAQIALQLVQDRIRYLQVGMNGGNYVPQKPEETWALRYGDCKAKTLLLLALLHGAGIEAEAVLASSRLGDMVPDRLPSAAAFDHVLVRAVIDGRSLWLDGTGNGARIEDIGDTPAFRHVLPVRAGGAELMPLPMQADARPGMDIAIDADESGSIDLPSAFTARIVLRGPGAAGLGTMTGQMDARQRDRILGGFFDRFVGNGHYSSITMVEDKAAATTTLTARGVRDSLWTWRDKRMKRPATRSLGEITFNPDRTKAIWSAVPVVTPDPHALRFTLRLRLPNGGRDFTIEGEGTVVDRVAGRAFSRSTTLADGVVTVEERLDTLGTEIPASDIPAERDRLARARTRLPSIVAPANALRAWDMRGRDPAGATQVAATEAIYATAIAALEPGDASAWIDRAKMRRSIGDRTGALADFASAIRVAPTSDSYRQRARLLRDLGRLKEALADAQKAQALDPSSEGANNIAAELLAETGDLPGAMALLDQRIEIGGEARDRYRRMKADVMGEFGDPAAALAIMDDLIAEKPGSPVLLNIRCWIKGTRSVMIDTALKDCTSAIELSTDAHKALDSRALIGFRLGRYEDALADLNAVLAAVPGSQASRYLRGVVLGRLGRAQDGAVDLAIARHLSPHIDTVYARYGVRP
ncbi:tetratricopeptide repeat protein [Sphingobium sufflavum]|uniref:DUF3857 domain-containing protein n=1 Tax=Sphingobium sufflavum TaxID=1129547 RepID=UPI001F23202A|nr:tetratricopeptide repeat protein [Sphingobium sufflavum]MCE7795548.1 tetratricopeptide repeat protein [Sphingobium sufflavum]